MRIIEQRDVIDMMRRAHQTLANLRIISNAVAHGRCDADEREGFEDVAAALEIVRANGERAGHQARRMLASIDRCIGRKQKRNDPMMFEISAAFASLACAFPSSLPSGG